MRLAVVTSYFPFMEDPFRGQNSYRTLRRFPAGVEIRVFSPHAVYPRSRWLHPRSYRYAPPAVYTPPTGMAAEYFEYPAIPVLSRPFNSWLCLRRLLPRLRAWRPDVILNYWLYPDGHAAVMAGQRLGVPVVLTSIGSDLRRIPDALTRRYTRQALDGAAALITVSRELRERAMALGVAAGKIVTVPGGCDETVFHPGDRGEARARLGVTADAEVILFVGNLMPAKGVGELLGAFAQLRAQRPRAELVVIGQGPLSTDVQAAAGSSPVRLLSRLSDQDLALWQTAASLLTLPSYSEGCPNVVVEALACGRAVVASRVGGIPELVGDGDGILVEPRNATALAAALANALGTRWNEAAIAARHQRSWDDVARETLAVLESVRRPEREAR